MKNPADPQIRANHDHWHRLRPDRHPAASPGVIERHGDRFLDRIFTDAERARAERRAKNDRDGGGDLRQTGSPPARRCSDALGTGIRRGVWWRDMGVVNLPGGRPTMQLTGGALARLEALTPQGYEARIDLSITDDWPLAQAFVIISAVNSGKL